jgi:hypothetical protein
VARGGKLPARSKEDGRTVLRPKSRPDSVGSANSAYRYGIREVYRKRTVKNTYANNYLLGYELYIVI